MSRIPSMMEEKEAESSAPVRRRTAGHPRLPVGTGGVTVSGADSPSGSGFSLKNAAGCGRSLTSVDDFVQRHFGFLYLVASRRHADGTTKIQTPLEVGLVMRGRRRELNLTQGELACKIGVGRQWVSAVERGKSRAEPGLVLRTFRALGLAFSIDTGKHLRTGWQSFPGWGVFPLGWIGLLEPGQRAGDGVLLWNIRKRDFGGLYAN